MQCVQGSCFRPIQGLESSKGIPLLISTKIPLLKSTRQSKNIFIHPLANDMRNMIQYSPFVCTSGRSSMAELQPSKLATRVRFPSPAPYGSQGGVMAAAADSKSAARECVRVRVPPLAPTTNNMISTGGVSEWSMVQPWKGCVGASPPGVRIPPSPPKGEPKDEQDRREEATLRECI